MQRWQMAIVVCSLTLNGQWSEVKSKRKKLNLTWSLQRCKYQVCSTTCYTIFCGKIKLSSQFTRQFSRHSTSFLTCRKEMRVDTRFHKIVLVNKVWVPNFLRWTLAQRLHFSLVLSRYGDKSIQSGVNCKFKFLVD